MNRKLRRFMLRLPFLPMCLLIVYLVCCWLLGRLLITVSGMLIEFPFEMAFALAANVVAAIFIGFKLADRVRK
ncbi:hypothetical protein D9M68_715230 [compost metagenome]